MQELEMVVLTRADGLDTVCIKTEYLGIGTTAAAAATTTADGAQMASTGHNSTAARPLKVVLVNVDNDQPPRLAGRWKWDKTHPGKVVRVSQYDVPTSFYGDEDVIDFCQK